MKVWICPECGIKTESVMCKIIGEGIIGTDEDAELEFWEQGAIFCSSCGFEESSWGDTMKFEVVKK